MYKFVAPVKFHVAVTLGILIACIAAEVSTVDLLSTPVNVVKDLATAGSDGSTPRTLGLLSVWGWITAAEGPGAQLRRALLWLALAKLILSIFSYLRAVTQTWQSMSMVFYMRAAVYDRLQRVGFSFHDQHSTGQLINRALSDLQAVRHFVIVGMQSTLDIIFALGFYFLLLAKRSPDLALVALLPLPLWVWAIRRFAVLLQPIYRRQMAASDEVVQQLTENIAGVHVVRAFATEKHEIGKFRGACRTLLTRLLDAVRVRVQMNPVIRIIASASYIGLFALGAVLVQGNTVSFGGLGTLHGSLSIGDLVTIGIAMNQILGRLHQVNAISDAYQRAVVSSARLFEILDSPDTTPEKPDALPQRPGGGAVKFVHVSFGYAPGQSVLEDVSFSVPAGAVVALVGPTGSGKTTLANLLGRFYDPDMGRIEIDGQDLRDVTVRSVRDAVGYVFQETYLFSDTIARNIAYSDLAAPRERIAEAARIAQADEFIQQLPKKYGNMIGEYGASLSGGQKQRLAIARAILHNPRILVMDDALAAVDPETEAQIREGLERVMAGRTVFMICSRVSTARRADLILVLENGRITQRGTHDELLEQPGYYRDVASSQFALGGPGQAASHMDRMVRAAAKPSGRMISED